MKCYEVRTFYHWKKFEWVEDPLFSCRKKNLFVFSPCDPELTSVDRFGVIIMPPLPPK